MNNPFTATPSCPLYYQPLRFGGDVRLCTSSDYELGASQSVKFGGFFSCSVGNPLVSAADGEMNSTLSDWIHTCPMGYTQHLITIDNNCEISVCLEMGSYGRERLLLPKLPPYRTPQFNPNGSEPIAILGSRNTILIKNTQGEWDTYNITDPVVIEILKSASSRDISSKSQSSPSAGPSPVAIAALVLAIGTIVVIIVSILVIIYIARKSD